MFIELEIIKSHTFKLETDLVSEFIFLNINEIQQIFEDDNKTFIILKNGISLYSKIQYKELKQRINYIITKNNR